MKKTLLSLALMLFSASAVMAQGWPANYGGVMLQAFYWDSFEDTNWNKLAGQAEELGQSFDLVWLPQSGYCGYNSMGYDDLYWFNDYNSSFGTESELRSLIGAFKKQGIGTIADVVVNHRKNVSSWFDFPRETYKGVTYELTAADICKNDDGGAALAEANKQGVALSSNNDTGEDWGGMRDLDHKSQNVQTNVKAYLDFLKNDLGYAGFRYDMVKGYGAAYTGMYNAAAEPQYSVGEYWDGNVTAVKNWIDGTKVDGQVMSAAFDFPFRYTVRDAANGGDWSKLSGNTLASASAYNRYAVTFVENHDTEKRSNSDQDPLLKDTLAANAYMLAMPGTPCIFLKHWQAYKQELKSMIALRKLVGINNQTTVSGSGTKDYYAVLAMADMSSKMLYCVVGNVDAFKMQSMFVKVLSGYHYAYYLYNKMNVAWPSLASGTYYGNTQVELIAVSDQSGAQLVYTLDGSEPTAQSTKAASGEKLSLPFGQSTLKVGLLVGGQVKGVQTRQYNVVDFSAYDISIHVATDKVGWESVNFWSWGGDGTHAPAAKDWPGDAVTTPETISGRQWFTKNYRINTPTDNISFVFSTAKGSPQSVNVIGVNRTSFFEIAEERDGTNYKVNDVTSSYDPSAITTVTADGQQARIFTLDGREVTTPQRGHIYVVGGRKVYFGR